MHHQRINATKSWYHGPARYDCVFLEHNKDLPGFQAARVRMFFRSKFRGIDYPRALIHWFSARGEHSCPETGMWIVTPDTVAWSCHHPSGNLIGVAGLHNFGLSDSLDAFKAFYVNQYADHHAHKIAF
ncbi:hypothetical protein B0H11DRAFT_2156508 [Mycena galericulata]|nr:hypothetical protein B0H11DRAFT_2156508 [Mycena galericulata]